VLGNTRCVLRNVRVGTLVAIYATKPRKECGCLSVLIPNSEPDRFEFHNGIINHNAPNCKDI